MKKRTLFRAIFTLPIIVIYMLIAFGSTDSKDDWKKKQFDTNEDLTNAFSYTKYDEIVNEFGEPYYKEINFVNEGKFLFECRWKGLGVKGRRDAVLVFTSIQYPSGYEPFKFYAMQATEAGYK